MPEWVKTDVEILLVGFDCTRAAEIHDAVHGIGYKIAGIGQTLSEAYATALESHFGMVMLHARSVVDPRETDAFNRMISSNELPVLIVCSSEHDVTCLSAEIIERCMVLSWPCSAAELLCAVELTRCRHEADRRVSESEAKLARTEALARLGSWVWEIAEDRITWSDEMCRLYGYAPHEIEPTFDFAVSAMHPDDRERVLHTLQASVDRGLPYDAEFRVIAADGALRYLHSRGDIETDPEGRPIRVIGTALEVTDLKVAEQAARAGEKKFVSIFEASPDPMAITRRSDGTFLHVNEAFLREMRCTREDVINTPASELRNYVDSTARYKMLAELAGRGKIDQREIRFRRGDDTVFWGAVSAVPIEIGGEPCILSVTRDITKQKEDAEALRHSEQLYRSVIENIQDVFYRSDSEGRLLMGSPSGARMFGYESIDEMIGLPLETFWADADDRRALVDILTASGQVKDFEGVLRRKDGSTFIASFTTHFYRDENGVIQGTEGIIRDVTERKKMEEQLLHAQKMEAIGTLAGGIAHDVNNLLQIVLGHTDLLLLNGNIRDRDRESLEAVRQAAQSGGSLAQSILTFSRKTKSRMQAVDLNREVRRALQLLERTVPKTIVIETHLAADLHLIQADPAQVEQILLNLAANSKDAMPEGGRLVIGTESVSIDHQHGRSSGGPAPGEYVMLSVSDTGAGIPEDIMDNIFDPFYTTKAPGHGTGLGLSMVFGLVKSHRGHIVCDSRAGTGTQFRIYFPVPTEPLPVDDAPTSVEVSKGDETVLLVDDDEPVRSLAKEMLEWGGYQVLTAGDGIEAIEIYAERSADISLVLLDLIMPVMGGKQCLEEMLKINPDALVLIASGHCGESVSVDAADTRVKGFLPKPYDARRLLKEVRRILDGDG
jgi:PAS domain S-box-containing protein